eukprot:573487-Pelagomonas_calceolata.AAC.2
MEVSLPGGASNMRHILLGSSIVLKKRPQLSTGSSQACCTRALARSEALNRFYGFVLRSVGCAEECAIPASWNR